MWGGWLPPYMRNQKQLQRATGRACRRAGARSDAHRGAHIRPGWLYLSRAALAWPWGQRARVRACVYALTVYNGAATYSSASSANCNAKWITPNTVRV